MQTFNVGPSADYQGHTIQSWPLFPQQLKTTNVNGQSWIPQTKLSGFAQHLK